MSVVFDLTRTRFLGTCSPGPSSFNSFSSGLSTASLQQVACLDPTSFCNTYSSWTGQHICRIHLVKKHFSCRRKSDARCKLVLCTHQTIRPNLSVDTSLMSNNPSPSNPVSVPTWSKLFPSLWNAPVVRKFTQFSVSTSVKLPDTTVRSCLQIHVRCVRSDFQVLLHRD